MKRAKRDFIFNVKLDLVLYRFYMDVVLDGLKNRAHTTNLKNDV